jgi:hypothetical protein
MSEGSGRLWSREWWLSAVLIGVAVHLLASYLKPRIDLIARRATLWWATRSQDRRVERAKRIRFLQLNFEDRMAARLAGLQLRLSSIESQMFMVAFAFLSLFALKQATFPYWVSVVCMGLAMMYGSLSISGYIRASRIAGELREALGADESHQSEATADQETSATALVPRDDAECVMRGYEIASAPNPEPQPDSNRTSRGPAG